MLENPNPGVVDGDGHVHYTRNLLSKVARQSHFVQANPMLTIVATALRLAQHLEIRLGDRFV
jgi:hypothetical protein